MGDNSASTKVCSIIKDLVAKNYSTDITVKVVPLMKYDLKPCILCGRCSNSSSCIYDNDFNDIYKELSNSDDIFFVVPHYSPIPSKLLIAFEKLNEFAYAGWLKDKNFSSPLSNIPVGIVGHGGCAESKEVLKNYHDNLVAPIKRTLESLSLDVVGLSEEFPFGAVFGLKDDKCLKESSEAIFPDIIQDYDMIRERIEPLVFKVMNKLK
jgi:hypothetical protein